MKVKSGILHQIISFAEANTAVCLFFSMLVVTVFTFSEYGVGFDTQLQRTTGFLALAYIIDPGAYGELYLNHRDADYPVFFELILAGAELFYAVIISIFEYSGDTFNGWKTQVQEIIQNSHQLDNPSTHFRHFILIRHFITHCFFLLSALYAYKLVYLLYKNKTLAVIAFFLIVLHPRLYAHSFFNSKDIPFLSMFIISLYYTAVTLKHKTNRNFIILGICSGILTNLRIIGLMLPCFVIFFLALDMLREKNYWFYTKKTGILAFVCCITLYISWPYLWSAPIDNFITAVASMRNFNRTISDQLFFGNIYSSTEVPASYIPVWFSITTPVIYLFFGFFGLILVILNFLKQPMNLLYNLPPPPPPPAHQRFFLICCAVFLAPVILVILFKSSLYNGWRHLYFIYAGFVFLAIYGIDFLMQKNKKIIYIPFIAFIFCSIYLIRAYPIQQTYFNELIPKDNEYISKNFEMDYWNVSFKDALEYILKEDKSSIIKVHTHSQWIANKDIQFLKPESARLIYVKKMEAADYVVAYSNIARYYNPIHTIKRQNNTIAAIYKIKNQEF